MSKKQKRWQRLLAFSSIGLIGLAAVGAVGATHPKVAISKIVNQHVLHSTLATTQIPQAQNNLQQFYVHTIQHTANQIQSVENANLIAVLQQLYTTVANLTSKIATSVASFLFLVSCFGFQFSSNLDVPGTWSTTPFDLQSIGLNQVNVNNQQQLELTLTLNPSLSIPSWLKQLLTTQASVWTSHTNTTNSFTFLCTPTTDTLFNLSNQNTTTIFKNTDNPLHILNNNTAFFNVLANTQMSPALKSFVSVSPMNIKTQLLSFEITAYNLVSPNTPDNTQNAITFNTDNLTMLFEFSSPVASVFNPAAPDMPTTTANNHWVQCTWNLDNNAVQSIRNINNPTNSAGVFYQSSNSTYYLNFTLLTKNIQAISNYKLLNFTNSDDFSRACHFLQAVLFPDNNYIVTGYKLQNDVQNGTAVITSLSVYNAQTNGLWTSPLHLNSTNSVQEFQNTTTLNQASQTAAELPGGVALPVNIVVNNLPTTWAAASSTATESYQNGNLVFRLPTTNNGTVSCTLSNIVGSEGNPYDFNETTPAPAQSVEFSQNPYTWSNTANVFSSVLYNLSINNANTTVPYNSNQSNLNTGTETTGGTITSGLLGFSAGQLSALCNKAIYEDGKVNGEQDTFFQILLQTVTVPFLQILSDENDNFFPGGIQPSVSVMNSWTYTKAPAYVVSLTNNFYNIFFSKTAVGTGYTNLLANVDPYKIIYVGFNNQSSKFYFMAGWNQVQDGAYSNFSAQSVLDSSFSWAIAPFSVNQIFNNTFVNDATTINTLNCQMSTSFLNTFIGNGFTSSAVITDNPLNSNPAVLVYLENVLKTAVYNALTNNNGLLQNVNNLPMNFTLQLAQNGNVSQAYIVYSFFKTLYSALNGNLTQTQISANLSDYSMVVNNNYTINFGTNTTVNFMTNSTTNVSASNANTFSNIYKITSVYDAPGSLQLFVPHLLGTLPFDTDIVNQQSASLPQTLWTNWLKAINENWVTFTMQANSVYYDTGASLPDLYSFFSAWVQSLLGNAHWNVYQLTRDASGKVISTMSLVNTATGALANLTGLNIALINNTSNDNINLSNLKNQAQWANYFNTFQPNSHFTDSVPVQVLQFQNELSFTPQIARTIQNITYETQTWNTLSQHLSSPTLASAFVPNTTNEYISDLNDDNIALWLTPQSLLNCLQAIQTANKTVLSNFTVLTLANLNFASLTSDELNAILSYFPSLQQLTIQNCGVAINDLNLSNTNLTRLNLNNNALTGTLTIPSSLQMLNVNNNALTSIAGLTGMNKITKTCALTVFSAANNKITWNNLVNDNNFTTTPSNTVLPVAYLNLSNNKLQSFSSDPFITTPSAVHSLVSNNGNNTQQKIFSVPLQTLNLANNQILSFGNFTQWTSNNIYTIQEKRLNDTGMLTFSMQFDGFVLPNLLTLNLAGQNATAYWFYNFDNNTQTPSFVGIGQNQAANGVGGNYGLNLLNTLGPDPFAGVTAPAKNLGLLNQTAFDQNIGSASKLNNALNNTNAASYNGYEFLTQSFLESATYTINTTNINASLSYNDLLTYTNGYIPYNDVALYELLAEQSKLTFNAQTLYTIFNSNFNLAGQQLLQYKTISALPTNLQADAESLNPNLPGESIMTVNGNSQVLLAVYQNDQIVYYLSQATLPYHASQNVYAHLTIQSAADGGATLTANLLLVQKYNNVPLSSLFPGEGVSSSGLVSTQAFSSSAEFDLGNVTSLNGTDGFYNLGESGLLSTLTTDPFDMGINQQLWWNFLHDPVYTKQGNDLVTLLNLTGVLNPETNKTTKTQTLAANTNSTITFSNYVADLTQAGGTALVNQFANNFYNLLQEEGLISYHQEYTIYGTDTKNQFQFSPLFLKSNFNLEPYVNNTESYYGIHYAVGNTLLDNVNPNESDFYQSPVWANFLNTEAKFKTGYDAATKTAIYTTETIGQYLYNWGLTQQTTWNHTMPSYNNPVFNNQTAKTAYENILNTYNLPNNLTGTQFNTAIEQAGFWNLDSQVANSTIANEKLEGTGAEMNLYNVFSYNDGLITNEYFMYTSYLGTGGNALTYGLQLNYINTPQNFLNTSNYLFDYTLYGVTQFSANQEPFNVSSNIVSSAQSHISLVHPVPYTTAQLENNEAEGLIADATFDDPETAQLLPLRNLKTLDEAHFMSVLTFSLILAFLLVFGIVTSGTILGLYLKKKHKAHHDSMKKEAKTKQLNVETGDSRVRSNNVDDDWQI